VRAYYLLDRPSQRGGFFYPAGFPFLAKRVHGLKQQLLFFFSFFQPDSLITTGWWITGILPVMWERLP
jgi:hypothetical protein